MKKLWVAFAILAVMIGYKLWHKNPQEKAEQVVKEWMKHSYGDNYESVDISYIDTLNYSREMIEEMEAYPDEIKEINNILRSYSELDYEKMEETLISKYLEMYEKSETVADDWLEEVMLDLKKMREEFDNLKKKKAELIYKSGSLKSSNQFLGYSVRHTYKVRGQDYNVFFLLDKEITCVTDTIHYNYQSLRYLGAFKEIF